MFFIRYYTIAEGYMIVKIAKIQRVGSSNMQES